MAKRRRISDKELIRRLRKEKKGLQQITARKRKLLKEKRELIKIKRELKRLRIETGRDIISRMKRAKISPEKRRKAKRILSKIGRRLDKIDFSFDDL